VDARDVVHDAIARVIELAPYLRGGDSSVGAYFLTVAWSRAVRVAKVRRRLVPLEPVEGREYGYRSDLVQHSGTPLEWLTAWETIEARERVERIRAERAAERARPLHVPLGEILAARERTTMRTEEMKEASRG
jgi:DNA-directed RNA polymerase specialized sigma24 family protein